MKYTLWIRLHIETKVLVASLSYVDADAAFEKNDT